MTRNNAHKQAIRDRMVITKEPYNVAKRNIEANETTIWELGEHGGYWFIEGTLNIDIANQVLKTWLLETAADTINDYAPFKERLSYTPRTDWFWTPLNIKYPKDEAVLNNKETHLTFYKNEPLMNGIYIQEK